MLNMLYIPLEALRHNKCHARTSTSMNQKGYRTTAYFFSTGRNAKRVIYPKSSGIICQDFYLDKPERILIEQTPIFFCVSKC